MSVNWRQQFFNNMSCEGVTMFDGNGDVTVKGKVNSKNPSPLVVFWASNPPDYRSSFSGSGLPFANPTQAYDRTPNYGAVRAVNGQFEFKVKSPNAYYTGLGSLYVPPHVNVKVCDEKGEEHHIIELGQGVPYRTLTYPSPPTKKPRLNPMFYCNDRLPDVRSQEQILRDSGYPSTHQMSDDFWGLRPPR